MGGVLKLTYSRRSIIDGKQSSYFENVGDTMWQTRLHILHCPFCGEKLPELGSVDQANYGYFQHNDFSRWK